MASRFSSLVDYLPPNVINMGGQFWAPLYRQRPRPSEINFYHFTNSRRTLRHDDYVIRKVNSFINLVSDKNNRFVILTPNPQQFFLHDFARLCIECRKWFV